ncbi:MAG: hypothetical protein ACTSU6_05030 [Candidatus Njordarchaeales archaeon]
MLRRKMLTIMLIFITISATVPIRSTIQNSEKEASLTNYSLNISYYAEFLDVFLGKQGALIYVFSSVGGNYSINLNMSSTLFSNVYFIRIAYGSGHAWWRYWYKPIWQDIPPGFSMTIGYMGINSQEALQKTNQIISSLSDFGVEGIINWIGRRGTLIVVNVYLFYSEEASGALTSYFNMSAVGFIKMFSTDNLINSPYVRGYILLVRDINDIDQDSNTSEFVPIIGLALVIPNAIIKRLEYGQLYFDLTVKGSLQFEGNIEPAPFSNVSVIRILFPIPVHFISGKKPDNSDYLFTNKYIYVLRYRNHSRFYDDINLRFKLFSLENINNNVASLTAAMSIDDVKEIFYGGMWFYNVSLGLRIENYGDNLAKNVTVMIPLPEKLILFLLIHYGHNLSDLIGSSQEITFRKEELYTIESYMIQAKVDEILPNMTKIIRIWIMVPKAGILEENLTFYLPIGGIILYRLNDSNIIRYSIANSLLYYNSSYIQSTLKIEPNWAVIQNETEQLEISLNVTNYGSSTVYNVQVSIIAGIISNNMFLDNKIILNKTNLGDLLAGETKQIKINVTPHFTFGRWGIGAIVSYGTNSASESRAYVLSSFQDFVSIPSTEALIEWRKNMNLAIPKAELETEKEVRYIPQTNELIVTITVRNIGNIPTIFRIVDWMFTNVIDMTKGYYGIIDLYINGTKINPENLFIYNTALPILVFTHTQLLTLSPNNTIIIRYIIKLKENVNISQVKVPPAKVYYDFGKYHYISEQDSNNVLATSLRTIKWDWGINESESTEQLAHFRTLSNIKSSDDSFYNMIISYTQMVEHIQAIFVNTPIFKGKVIVIIMIGLAIGFLALAVKFYLKNKKELD